MATEDLGNLLRRQPKSSVFVRQRGKAPAIIALPLQDDPETLHRAVVDALSNAGHTLGHPSFLKFVMKGSAGVLNPSVAVKQRMNIGVGFLSLVNSLKDKRIVVTVANHAGNNAPVVQVKDGAQG